ncbi:hypothetical protein CIB48_g6775 [Xylaria polymorpha]|nr:hypothetical protein CIB48_g6775 [Xylaria polymorpha]
MGLPTDQRQPRGSAPPLPPNTTRKAIPPSYESIVHAPARASLADRLAKIFKPSSKKPKTPKPVNPTHEATLNRIALAEAEINLSQELEAATGRSPHTPSYGTFDQHTEDLYNRLVTLIGADIGPQMLLLPREITKLPSTWLLTWLDPHSGIHNKRKDPVPTSPTQASGVGDNYSTGHHREERCDHVAPGAPIHVPVTATIGRASTWVARYVPGQARCNQTHVDVAWAVNQTVTRATKTDDDTVGQASGQGTARYAE